MSMDTTLPTTTSLLFNVPKLAKDSTNCINYKEQTLTAIGAQGLMGYTNGRAKKPVMFKVDSKTNKLAKDDGTEPTPTEIEYLNKKIDEFHQKNSLVKQQVFSTISDQLLLCIQ
jgi:hypothetical protein